jgi:hypothetical protein
VGENKLGSRKRCQPGELIEDEKLPVDMVFKFEINAFERCISIFG